VAFAIECPQFLPSIFLYAIAYALLMNNYYLSSHPSPWSRVRSFGSIIATSRFGSSSSRLPIEPETGVEEADTLRLLDEYKMHRVTGFLYEILNTSLKVYKVYSKNTPVDISTVAKSGSLFSQLYVDYLAYAHMMLRGK
jgi:Pyruvate/2-oxoacid:ferredoxin oxidoreductase gamma subunit